MKVGIEMEYKIKEEALLKRCYDVELSNEETASVVEEIIVFLAMQSGVDYIANQPRKALRKRFGDDIDDRIAICLANQCADSIIEREHLSATMEPIAEDMSPLKDGEGFSCTVTIFVKPQLELTSYDPVSVLIDPPCVTDEMVERSIADLVDRRARLVEDKEASSASEKTVNVVSVDTTKHGMQVQALTSPNTICYMDGASLPPEIEREIVGMRPGERKIFSFSVVSKNFLGLDVEEEMECSLELKSIVRKEIPEIDDEWVRSCIPGAHDVGGFRDLVRGQLESQASSDYERAKNELVVAALADRLESADGIPESYFDYVRAGLLQNVSTALSRQGMTKEQLYAAQGMSDSQFMMQMKMRAKAVLLQGLALDAYALHHGIEASEADLENALRSIAPGNEDQTRRMLEMNGRTYQLREMALRSKTRALLVSEASEKAA